MKLRLRHKPSASTHSAKVEATELIQKQQGSTSSPLRGSDSVPESRKIKGLDFSLEGDIVEKSPKDPKAPSSDFADLYRLDVDNPKILICRRCGAKFWNGTFLKRFVGHALSHNMVDPENVVRIVITGILFQITDTPYIVEAS